LLEVYHRVRAPDGSPLLFEAYLPFRFVNETAHSVWRSFLPALLAALVVLALLQLPLGWSLARRLRDRQREREILLHRAIDASHAERRRIASDLHDGVVQDLAGLSFGLAAAADRAPAAADSGVQRALREGSRDARQALRRLRTALVQIHPPDLHRAGLGQALSDLLSPLRTAGIDATLQVDEALELDPEIERLMFRGAQEALRNITEHADARSVRVTLTGGPHVARLDVADDGSGFTEEERTRRMERGHIGLQLLEGLVAQAGGTLVVRSSTGEGTRFVLELPG
jgi:signal transduction histidine kinase